MNAIVTNQTNTIQIIDYHLRLDPGVQSAHTKDGYRRDLVDFMTWRGNAPLTKTLVESYIAHLQEKGLAASTVNRKIASIRWFATRLADQAMESGHDVSNPAVQAALRIGSVKNVRGESADTGIHIYQGELLALMTTCALDHAPSGRRDAAMFAIVAQTGMRIGELLALTIDDWLPNDDGSGVFVIQSGKGNKGRKTYIYNGTRKAVDAWLSVRGDESGPLFCRINKGGRMAHEHGISQPAANKMRKKRLVQAKITRNVQWHDFRRTFAGNLLDNGHDLVTVQKLMGHESPITTARYDRRGEEVKRNAVQSLHIPYIDPVS